MQTKSYSFQEETFEALDERVINATLDNGLSVRFVPRDGFRSGKAMLSARVGGIDTRWTNTNGKRGSAPAGIAHYLEHQLFKKRDGDLSEAFAELGAYVNAHTSHTATSYYTDFVSNRDENLRLLFRLFFEEYFDKKLVDIERDIIIQEIRLYRDRPYWVIYGAMLEALYSKHAIRFDIAGDEESVSKIGPTTLLRTHRAFYAPNNSCLTLSGDWDPNEILDCVASMNEEFAPAFGAQSAEYWDWKEPDPVKDRFREITLPTPEERFLKGFKLPVAANIKDSLRQEMLGNLALDLAFGNGTEFQEELYGTGVIAGDFSHGLHVERSFAYASIGGKCRDFDALEHTLDEASNQILAKGFKKSDFERKVRNIKGKALRRFDTVSSTVDIHAEAWLSGLSPFASIEILDAIDVEDLNQAFEQIVCHAPASTVHLRGR